MSDYNELLKHIDEDQMYAIARTNLYVDSGIRRFALSARKRRQRLDPLQQALTSAISA